MATKRQGGHKGLKAAQLEAEKENRAPPKGIKRMHSISSLFNNTHSKRHRGTVEVTGDGLATKSKHNEDAGKGIFQRFRAKTTAEQDPMYLNFAAAAKAYQDGASAAEAAQIEPVYEELVARTHRLDIHGRPLQIPGLPSDAEMDALDAERLALTKPLGEEQIEVQVRQADGSMKRKHVTLQESMDAFRRRFSKKRGELESLQRQLVQVSKDIVAARDDVVDDQDGAIKRADDKLQAKLEKVDQNTKIFRDLTFAEVQQAEREDKAAAAETNRKIQEFMKALQ